MYKALPDTLEEFQDYFVDAKTNDMKNKTLFKRRILGLTSYYRSAQEQLMPKFDKGKNFHGWYKSSIANYHYSWLSHLSATHDLKAI